MYSCSSCVSTCVNYRVLLLKFNFCFATMCSVENLEGIVITDRDGVIILEGELEGGIASFSTVFENSLSRDDVYHSPLSI